MGKSQNRGKIWGIYHDTFDLAVFHRKSCTRALNSNSAFKPIVPKIQAIVPKIKDHRPENSRPSPSKFKPIVPKIQTHRPENSNPSSRKFKPIVLKIQTHRPQNSNPSSSKFKTIVPKFKSTVHKI